MKNTDFAAEAEKTTVLMENDILSKLQEKPLMFTQILSIVQTHMENCTWAMEYGRTKGVIERMVQSGKIEKFSQNHVFLYRKLEKPLVSKLSRKIFTHRVFHQVRDRHSQNVWERNDDIRVGNAERASGAYVFGYNDAYGFSRQEPYVRERRIFPRIAWWNRHPVLDIDPIDLDDIPF